jgi:predicted transcriptional regulator
MKNNGIRRLPVIDTNNALIGIITLDDITELLTEIVGCLSDVIKRQQKQEMSRRP